MDKSTVRPSRKIPSGVESPDEIAVHFRDYLNLNACANIKRRYGLSLQDMEDLLADAFEKMLIQLREGSGPKKSGFAWANTILENAVKDFLRHKKVRKVHQSKVAIQLQLELDARENQKPAEAANQNAALGRALSSLRAHHLDQANAVTLHSQGCSQQVIANKLGKSLANAKQLVARGLVRIRNHLRTEALMYHRQGKDPELIAAELGLPVRVVKTELLSDILNPTELRQQPPAVGDA